MDPNDFISFASKLAARPNAPEVDYRSAVSRAYYGALHIALQFLDELGIELPSNAEGHELVASCLQNSGKDTINDAGMNLRALRRERNRADYNLDDEKYQTQRNAMLRLHAAVDIARWVGACSSPEDRDSIKPRMEEHKRLRLGRRS